MHEQSMAHGCFCPAKGAQRQKETQKTVVYTHCIQQSVVFHSYFFKETYISCLKNDMRDCTNTNFEKLRENNSLF